ncbi:MAG: PP2C family protein-serine/threonine phosphatase [Nocardioidaceae bacterium]
MTITLRYTAISDLGQVRRNNQDSGYASPRLLVVADGMGGGPAGDLASAVTVESVRTLDAPPPADLLAALGDAVRRANDRLGEIVDSDPAVEGMGSTLTAILAADGRVGLAHVGDSRAYLLRQGELRQLTHDQTLVQTLVDEGRISSDEARVHPHRSLILQVLDGRHGIKPDLEMLTLQDGDRLLLCSDGLTGFVEDEHIADLLGAETIDAAAVELVQAALEAGSSDNITCVVAEAVTDAPAGQSSAPMLVGAAAEQPRSRTSMDRTATQPAVRIDEDDESDVVPVDDEAAEQRRYAPRAPNRYGWLRRLVATVLTLALLTGVALVAYRWSQRQYYVSSFNGKVAIYQGLDQELPGVDLNSLHEEYDLLLTELPTYQRGQVEAGIEADNLSAAQGTVAQLQLDAQKCASEQIAAGTPACEGASTTGSEPTTKPTTEPTTKPTPEPTDKPTAKRTRKPR